MRRMPIPSLLLAATLALLLPLEQAHCAWMGFEKHAAPTAAPSPIGHECCESPATSRSDNPAQPEKDSTGCVCQQLPTGVLPAVITAGTRASSVTSIAVLSVPSVVAPVSIASETVPALDVGSPPLPDEPGARGVRAPPVSA